jgi:hypothetical protein
MTLCQNALQLSEIQTEAVYCLAKQFQLSHEAIP